jgi:hypothetical protein
MAEEAKITLSEANFVSFCSNTIINTKQTIEKTLCDAIEYSIRESLKHWEQFLDVSYHHIFEYYDKCLSLKEYIEDGYIRIYSLELILELQKGKNPLDLILCLPEYFMIIEPDCVHYNDSSKFKFRRKVSLYKKTALKTKPKYSFNLSEVGILHDILTKIAG